MRAISGKNNLGTARSAFSPIEMIKNPPSILNFCEHFYKYYAIGCNVVLTGIPYVQLDNILN